MLIVRLSRALPGLIARRGPLLARAFPILPPPQALPVAPTALWLRQKHNRHGPRNPNHRPPFNSQLNFQQNNPNPNPNTINRTPGSPTTESQRQDRLSEETAELNDGVESRGNTAPLDAARNSQRNNQGPSRTNRTPTSQAAQSRRQDKLSEETAELNDGSESGDNTAPRSQPGPGKPDELSYPSEASEPPPLRKPLPDLRQGIPSTFAEEFLNQKPNARSDDSATKAHHEINITDDPTHTSSGGAGEGSGRDDGELPKSAYQTSIDKRRERLAFWSYISLGAMGVVGAVYLGRDWDTEEEERAHPDAPSGWNLSLFYNRIKARVSGQMGYYTEPTFPKLLPDIEPAPPYTLVLSLEDLMIHSEWTREHGWRTAKRPGVDYFLGYLSQYYELVLFTSLPVSAADQIVRKLDPYHFMTFPLFREATRYEKGQYVKDLSYLNRPLSKTILLDTKAEHAKAQPENAIILKPWKGESGDRDLVALIPFLEQIAAMQIPDVRTALKSYEGKHIPTEFALREAKAREEFHRQLAEEQAKKPKRSGLSFLNSALGMKPAGGGMTFDGTHSVADGLAEGKMLADQIRESGIKQYKKLEQEIRENGEKWLKEEAEMEKKMQQEQMKSMKSGALSFWGGSGGGKSGEGNK